MPAQLPGQPASDGCGQAQSCSCCYEGATPATTDIELAEKIVDALEAVVGVDLEPADDGRTRSFGERWRAGHRAQLPPGNRVRQRG